MRLKVTIIIIYEFMHTSSNKEAFNCIPNIQQKDFEDIFFIHDKVFNLV